MCFNVTSFFCKLLLLFGLVSPLVAQVSDSQVTGQPAEQKEDSNPEANVTKLVEMEGRVSEEGPYLLIDRYFGRGQPEYAIRAAKKLVELRPQDGKAWGVLGFSLIKIGRGDEAVDILKRSISFGYEKSAVYLAFHLESSGANFSEYIPLLLKIRSNHRDAYKPLLVYTLSIENADERKGFAESVLRETNLADLVEDKEIVDMLTRYFESVSDNQSVKKIKDLRRTYVRNKTSEMEEKLRQIRQEGSGNQP